MTHQRTAYEDLDTTKEMSTDCHAVERVMRLPRQVVRSARGALNGVPDNRLTTPLVRANVVVSDAAKRMGARFID